MTSSLSEGAERDLENEPNGVHRHAIRIYYEDTDAGGIVYHASYIRFMERARTEFLRELGLPPSAVKAEHDILFVVSNIQIAYRVPARLDDLLIVETAPLKVGGSSIRLSQRITRGETLICDAEILCAAINETGVPVRMPPQMRAKLTGDA